MHTRTFAAAAMCSSGHQHIVPNTGTGVPGFAGTQTSGNGALRFPSPGPPVSSRTEPLRTAVAPAGRCQAFRGVTAGLAGCASLQRRYLSRWRT